MTTTTDLTIRPFEVHVPEEDLADLRRRIAAWRPPEREPSMISHRACSSHGWPGSIIDS